MLDPTDTPQFKKTKLSACEGIVAIWCHLTKPHGMATDLEKTRLMQAFPQLTNQTLLRGLFGLTSYYCDFVPKYAAS
jgi:hypothetical protein